MSSIFVLKPIIDVLYDEMNEYKQQIVMLTNTIKRLESENNQLRRNRGKEVRNEVVEVESEDDENFAEAAAAPPASSPAGPVVQEEKQVKSDENVRITKEEGKQVRIINGKDAREYMKEYQRSYRKKQKENAQTS